ncbi:MAG: hypothetical protein VXZ38_11450 [Planctomycetota bacterium]|nr:hypothetical protein [Planctomycetota bacterium]
MDSPSYGPQAKVSRFVTTLARGVLFWMLGTLLVSPGVLFGSDDQPHGLNKELLTRGDLHTDTAAAVKSRVHFPGGRKSRIRKRRDIQNRTFSDRNPFRDLVEEQARQENPKVNPQIQQVGGSEYPLPTTLEPSALEIVSTPFDEQALRLFQEASQGEISETATGDWILDDALKMMRQTGPISSKLAASPGFDRLDSPLSEETEKNELKTEMSTDELDAVKVAEQLLRSARLMQKLSNLTPSEVALIKKMREEASVLLQRKSRIE